MSFKQTRGMSHPLLNYLAKKNGNTNGEYEEAADVFDDLSQRLKITISLPNVDITRVTIVHNNYLEGMYELKKMEYKSRYGSVQEVTLVHSTSAYNVTSIIKDNLDWRRVTRNKYGKGVSFSDDADYANFHSNRGNGEKRAFIVAKVLVSTKLIGHGSMVIPPLNVDTSISNTGKVYVKYSDNEFLIKYIVYYNAPDRTKSKHYRRPRHHFLLCLNDLRDSNFVSLQGSERVILLIGIMHPLLEYLSRKNKNTNGVYEEDASPIEENLATSSILPTLPAVCITRVTTVHNNYLHGMYELKKLEYESRYGSVQELTLVHSTSALKVPSIIKTNLDWRRVTRNKYGKGVSFSNDANYGNFHSNRCNGEKRAFIIAKVLISRKDYGYDFVVIPLPNVDTSISSSENVYVKYSDNEFLIKYIVYYDAPDRTKSKHYRIPKPRFLLW
ncbi:uncharacterized protein LOC128989311 [Macrosteles quadrilineatus]|uniref:uncharacterized protein LOC128989311 n=1 Tax=Macrosteles quadrilineatus TaxID=74068 RepID=UPI0023E25BC5|nr:uncharacterized protein LOC128989311 [Macrosteles quadrilineatus]